MSASKWFFFQFFSSELVTKYSQLGLKLTNILNTHIFFCKSMKLGQFDHFLSSIISDVSEIDFREPSQAKLDIHRAELSRGGPLMETSWISADFFRKTRVFHFCRVLFLAYFQKRRQYFTFEEISVWIQNNDFSLKVKILFKGWDDQYQRFDFGSYEPIFNRRAGSKFHKPSQGELTTFQLELNLSWTWAELS